MIAALPSRAIGEGRGRADRHRHMGWAFARRGRSTSSRWARPRTLPSPWCWWRRGPGPGAGRPERPPLTLARPFWPRRSRSARHWSTCPSGFRPPPSACAIDHPLIAAHWRWSDPWPRPAPTHRRPPPPATAAGVAVAGRRGRRLVLDAATSPAPRPDRRGRHRSPTCVCSAQARLTGASGSRRPRRGLRRTTQGDGGRVSGTAIACCGLLGRGGRPSGSASGMSAFDVSTVSLAVGALERRRATDPVSLGQGVDHERVPLAVRRGRVLAQSLTGPVTSGRSHRCSWSGVAKLLAEHVTVGVEHADRHGRSPWNGSGRR